MNNLLLLIYNLSLISTLMGGLRSKPDLNKSTIQKTGQGFSYVSSSMCGWRLYMEDAHIATNLSDFKSYLFGIFDGHGGGQVSIFAANNFIKLLQKNIYYKSKNYQAALKDVFFKLDQLLLSQFGQKELKKIKKQLILQQNSSNNLQSNAGCTANICLITPQSIYLANAGDTRSILCRHSGQIVQLSHDHKPNNHLQKERIVKAGGKIIDGRINGNINLSRSIGDFDYKMDKHLSPQDQMITVQPQIVKIKNQAIDFIIMGCDGIWQSKSNEQMVDWIKLKLKTRSQFSTILQQLFDELVAKDIQKTEDGLDNMSAILIKFNKYKK